MITYRVFTVDQSRPSRASRPLLPLTPFFAAHPGIAPLSPFVAALTKTGPCKSFACRTYEKAQGGTPSPFQNGIFLECGGSTPLLRPRPTATPKWKPGLSAVAGLPHFKSSPRLYFALCTLYLVRLQFVSRSRRHV